MKIGEMVSLTKAKFTVNGRDQELKAGKFLEVWPETTSDILYLQQLHRSGFARADTRCFSRKETLPIMVTESAAPLIHAREIQNQGRRQSEGFTKRNPLAALE